MAAAAAATASSSSSSSVLSPPLLPDGDDHDAPNWVLLDILGYMGDHHRNANFAESNTSTGELIQVSFHTARPPKVSHFCVYSPDLTPAGFAVPPKVISADSDLILFRVSVCRRFRVTPRYCDYFVYRAHPRNPSLDLLPHPYPNSFRDRDVALLSLGDDNEYAVAALTTRYPDEDGMPNKEFNLYRYRSSKAPEGWTSKVVSLAEPLMDKACPFDSALYHDTTKVIIPGRGALGMVGWVDLWRGILVCNVLDENPVLRDVPLPPPSRGNWLLYHKHCSYGFRDITVSLSRDCIKYIEMEIGLPRDDPPDPPPASYLEWFYRKPRREVRDGWKATTWSIPIPIGSWKDWIPGLTVTSDEILVQPTEEAALLSVLVGSCPTMSMDDDVVYLLSKEAVTAVDLRNKTLRGVGKRVAGKDFASMHNWTCEISRYLNLNMAAAKREEDKQSDKLKEAGK
jgi:hypothetical protein